MTVNCLFIDDVPQSGTRSDRFPCDGERGAECCSRLLFLVIAALLILWTASSDQPRTGPISIGRVSLANMHRQERGDVA